MSLREYIIEKLNDIPAIPTGAIQALQVLQDPDTGLDAVAPLIMHDPALTAEILRVANSAAFAGRTNCVTIKDAVVRLGKNNVRQVLVTVGLGNQGRKAIQGYGLKPGELLAHSMLVAHASVHLATLLHTTAPREVFTAGLLHNIGKLVLGSYLEVDGDRLVKRAEAENMTFDEVETQVLGIDHAEVGAILLGQWGLPAEIVAAVRWHHRPEACAEPRLAAQLIHLADHICVRQGIGAGLDGGFYPPNSETVDALGYEPALGIQLGTLIRGDQSRLAQMFSFIAKPSAPLAVQITDPTAEPPAAATERRAGKSVFGFLKRVS